jgi:hypothetical protein
MINSSCMLLTPGMLCLQVAWDVKGQLQALRRARRHRDWLRLADPLVDVRVAAWLQTPDDSSTDPAVSKHMALHMTSFGTCSCLTVRASWSQMTGAQQLTYST